MINSFINFISNYYVLIIICVIFVILDLIVAGTFAIFNKTYSPTSISALLSDSISIKYNLFDLTSIKVYTTKGEYLCTAGRVKTII